MRRIGAGSITVDSVATQPQPHPLDVGAFEHVRIVGVGETRVGKLPGYGPIHLQAWAVLEALANAGIPLSEVDGIVNQDPYSQPYSMFSLALAEYLGLRPRWAATVDVGGSVTVMSMIQQAVWALASGHCQVCVVVQGENMATSRPAGVQGHLLNSRQGGDDFKEPYGALGAPVSYALVADRFRHERGATEDDFGAVAVQARAHAMRNPNRQTRAAITINDYRASPFLAEPLRVLDCSLVSDGGGALVLTTKAAANLLGGPSVGIGAFAMNATHGSIVNQPAIDDLGFASSAERAWSQAGIGPDDVDVVLLHDAFTFTVLLQLEEFGFAPRGLAGELVRSGATGPGGRWPVNPHGGLLSQAHFGGILHAVEAVRQLQGQAGGRQVPDARRAFLGANGGILSTSGVMVMERTP